MSEFKKRLGKMQGNWDAGKEKAAEFGDIPDGLYKMQLQDAEIVESQSSEKLQIHVEHLVLEGEQAGQVYHDYLQLETEWGPVFIAQFIEKLGREVPDNIDEMEEVISEIAEGAPIYMGKLKTKDDYQNLRITKLLEGEAEKTEVEKEDGDEGEELEWSKGERCTVEIDGEDFEGEVIKVKGKKATVKFDDGDTDTYPLIELSEIDEDEDEEEEEEEEETDEATESDKWTADEIMDLSAEDLRQLVEDQELEVKLGKAITAKKRKLVIAELEEADLIRESDDDEDDDEGVATGEEAPVASGGRVSVEIDGKDYEGEVTAVNLDEQEVTVKFDDGDEGDHTWGDITVLKINNQKSSKKKSKGKSKKSKGPSEDDLTAFCQAQDIEVDDDDDADSMKEKILEYDWEADQLTKDEVELCKQLGATVK